MANKKLLLNIIVIFFILIGGGFWYLNNIFLPVKIKNLLVEALAKETGRKISLSEVKFHLLRGFVLSGLTISEEKTKDREFLNAEKISLNFLLLPLLKERKLIIPAIYITSPRLNLVRDTTGRWNFSNLIVSKKESRSQSKFSLFIRKIIINDGQIFLEDNSTESAFSKKINKLNILAYLDLPLVIKFKTGFEIESAAVSLAGEYNLSQKELNLNLSSKQINLAEFLRYYKTQLPFELLENKTDVNFNLLINKDKKILLKGTILSKDIHLKKNLFELKGDSSIKGEFTYLVGDKESLRYNGELMIDNFLVKDLPSIKELKNLKGRLLFSQDKIVIEKLEGVVSDSPIQFNGDLKNLKDPKLFLTVESELELSKIKDLIPDELKRGFRDIEVEGKAGIKVTLNGELKKLPLDITGNISILNGSFKTPALAQRFKNISGNLSFEKNLLLVSNLAFEYNNMNYLLNETIENFSRPDIDLNLTSKDMSLTGKGILDNNNLNISRLEGRYKNSAFQITGEVNNLKDPYLNTNGKFRLSIEDMKLFMPANILDILTRFDLKGNLDVEISLLGRLKEPKDCNIETKIQSQRLYIKNLKLDDIFLELAMKDKKITLPTLRLSPYDGNLLFSADVDLSSQNPPYTIKVQLVNVDLKKLAQDIPLKDKNISGLLEGNLTLSGYGKDLQTLKGTGLFKISEGRLWEIPLLKELAGMLNLIALVSVEKAVFKEATGSFSVVNKYIITKDLKCKSDDITLSAEGALGFDRSLDFTITTLFSPLFAQNSQLGKIASIIIDETGNFLGKFELKGTLSQPKWTFSPLPLDRILKQKIKGLFEDILE